MPAYQYYMVALTDEADRYDYLLKSGAIILDSIRPPQDDSNYDLATHWIHYRVVAPKLSRPVALPAHAMVWTSIAYMVWDDVDPELFSLEQKVALIDWLHWGGQIIISGPASLDRLRGSFLDAYLPATSSGAADLTAADFADLKATYSRNSARRTERELDIRDAISGISFDTHPRAVALEGTDGLVVERRIGRGRVVATAFRLTQGELTRWNGFDNFFNACLLRRPSRRWSAGPNDFARLTWAASDFDPEDAQLTSNLRYFSRDTGSESVHRAETADVVDPYDPYASTVPAIPEAIIRPEHAGGVAAWDPFSRTARQARSVLREAAGIEVPDSGFVVKMLGVYLVVLVPVNWLLFTLVRRVEWAWAAAPVIAVLASLAVIRMAQIDIGFIRARTELATLELQGDYSRGHLTRYAALYTSLSTDYDLQFEDFAAVAQPFPSDTEFQMLTGQRRSTVTYRRADDVSLQDVSVRSNSTGLVHTEQQHELAGPLRVEYRTGGARVVVNDTGYDLHEVVIARRPPSDRWKDFRASESGRDEYRGQAIEACIIGDLPAGESAAIVLTTLEDHRAAVMDSNAQKNYLDLSSLRATAIAPQQLEPGELRLVGTIDEVLGGMQVQPASSQVRGATLVVAHLEYGQLPPATSDVNSIGDIEAFDRKGKDDDLSDGVIDFR